MTVRFFSDHFSTDGKCNIIEVEVIARAYASDDYGWEIEYIYDATADVGRELEDFPAKEQSFMEDKIEKYVYEQSHDIWQAQVSSYYENMVDACKDGTWND